MEAADELIDKLLLATAKTGVPLTDIAHDFRRILYNYDVLPKKREIEVYSGGKNEMYLKRFVIGKSVAGCTEKTVKNYYQTVQRILRRIGKDADKIQSDDIQYYFAQRLVDGITKSFADTERRYLSSFFVFLAREEIISKNPMLRVDKIKYQKKKSFAFTDLEVEKMRDCCKNNREKAIFETLMSTGCRVSELVQIKTVDIDGETVSVLGKGEKYRNVYLNPRAQIAIHNYLGERADNNPYLFPGGLNTKMCSDEQRRKILSSKGEWYKDVDLVAKYQKLDIGSVRQLLARIGKRAGVTDVHPHRFRRTCATFALRKGMPLELVSQMLGHAELTTTQIYLDISEDELKRAHQKYVG